MSAALPIRRTTDPVVGCPWQACCITMKFLKSDSADITRLALHCLAELMARSWEAFGFAAVQQQLVWDVGNVLCCKFSVEPFLASFSLRFLTMSRDY